MTTVLATALVLAQASLAPVPEPPALSSGEFKRAVTDVRRALAEGKFEEAEKTLSVMPRTSLTLLWEEGNVPQDLRDGYRAAFDEAAKAFAESPLKGSLTLSKEDPDIRISFTELLPLIEGSKRRQAAVFFVNFVPGEPRVEAVVALQRGLPLRPLERRDVAAEILHAVGLALGLVRVPREGGMMGRVDAPVRLPVRVAPPEVLLARANLEIVEALNQRLRRKVKEPFQDAPLASLEKTSLAMGTALQAGEMKTAFQVSNPGSTPLRYQIVPDCSCFSLRYTGTVEPGGVDLVQVNINTRDFPGPLNKGLYFYSNDPDKAMVRIPVTGMVTPAYRFLREKAEDVVLIPKEGAEETLYLVYPEDEPFQLLAVEAAGAPIKLAWKPWQGALPDEEYGEPSRQRVGYAITLQIPPRREPGRYSVSLQVRTSHQEFSTLSHPILVQTGIIASPSSLFLGRLTQSPSSGWVSVTRPGRPFKITKVASDSNLVEGAAEPQEDGSWRVRVRYKGKGPAGRLSALLTLSTDDPDQPMVPVPVSGVVE